MNRKLKKAIIITILIIIAFALVFNVAFVGHMLVCHEEHCEFCEIWHYVHENINSIAVTIVMLYLHVVMFYHVLNIFSKNYFIPQTLIKSKVQFNE